MALRKLLHEQQYVKSAEPSIATTSLKILAAVSKSCILTTPQGVTYMSPTFYKHDIVRICIYQIHHVVYQTVPQYGSTDVKVYSYVG